MQLANTLKKLPDTILDTYIHTYNSQYFIFSVIRCVQAVLMITSVQFNLVYLESTKAQQQLSQGPLY